MRRHSPGGRYWAPLVGWRNSWSCLEWPHWTWHLSPAISYLYQRGIQPRQPTCPSTSSLGSSLQWWFASVAWLWPFSCTQRVLEQTLRGWWNVFGSLAASQPCEPCRWRAPSTPWMKFLRPIGTRALQWPQYLSSIFLSLLRWLWWRSLWNCPKWTLPLRPLWTIGAPFSSWLSLRSSTTSPGCGETSRKNENSQFSNLRTPEIQKQCLMSGKNSLERHCKNSMVFSQHWCWLAPFQWMMYVTCWIQPSGITDII